VARVAYAAVAAALISIVAGLACDPSSGQAATARGCPDNVLGKRLVDSRGRTVYRYP
jgi:hypothetical protein